MVQVAYTSASDGTRIAYAVHGQGQPVVYMPPLPFRHVELEWESPEDRRMLDWLASRYTLVQYDPRGLGLSERNPAEYSLDALLDDIDAVIDAAAPDGAALLAAVNTGPLALAYALRHPGRVSHLILWCASPRGDRGAGPESDAIVDLVRKDWELATQTLSHHVRGWSASETAARLAALLRAAATPEAVAAIFRATTPLDLSDRLSEVANPTLVLHRRGVSWISVHVATELASRIPEARLVLLEGDSMAPWSGHFDAIPRAVDEFMGLPVSEEQAPSENTFRREGEYWTLAYAGEICRLREAKGLHHIAYLLARSGVPVTAAELLFDLEPPIAGENPSVSGDAGPVLDAEARRAYRARIETLREDLEDAEARNDTGRAEVVRAEQEAIEAELASALGLGGSDRRAASNAERARVTVTKRIRDSLARIRQAHPTLADHLDQGIRTGRVCAYRPAQPAPWSL